MISIIIPTYNMAEKLNSCLTSINNQTYHDYEIIIVDDGSVDNTKEVIENNRNKFQNFKYIYQKNSGANSARNTGLRNAGGDFLLFCDADLTLKKDMLRIMHETLAAHPEASYVYSAHYFGSKLFKLWIFDDERLKKMPCIHSTSLIRREHFPRTGWDESLKRLQDWDIWLTMLEEGHRGYWLDLPLFKVETGGTMSSWLPSFVYRWLPFLPKVKKYNRAVENIKEKHHLNEKGQ